MKSDVLVAILALIGTLSGTFAGIITSSKLTNYRIAQLEKKVDKHNNFAEKIPVLNEKITMLTNRLEEIERMKR